MEIVLLAIAVYVGFLLFSGKTKIGKTSIFDGSYYQKRPLSQIEQVAYWRLVEAIGEDKVVLSQVAFSSFIGTKGGSKRGNFSKFATARQKVADFVICNKDFSIFAIVEVDDKSHDQENDRLRDAITEEAGIRTYRVEAKSLPSVNELREALV